MRTIRNFLFIVSMVFIFEFFIAKKSEAAECTVTNGIYSKTQILASDGCETTPGIYEVVIFQLWLCTSEPTLPTESATVVLTNCSQIFENSAGATASVAAQNSSIELNGTYFKPPPGTYTHGYAMMDNTFGLTASFEIDGSMTGTSSGSGLFCATKAATGTHQTNGEGGTHTNNSICDSSEITPGKFVETLTHFDSSDQPWKRIAVADNINGTSASIRGILVDTNGHLAANEGEVVKLEGLVSFANSLKITTETTSLTMSFNLGEGMFLGNDGSNKMYIGSGPFQAIMAAN